jgi:hypothetical protein
MRLVRGNQLSAWIVLAVIPCAAIAQETNSTSPAARELAVTQKLTELGQKLPMVVDHFDAARAQACSELCRTLDLNTGTLLYSQMQRPEEWLERLQILTRTKAQVDKDLQRVLDLRFGLADRATQPTGRTALRAFLRISTDLIELSGRLNFHLRDGVIFASMAAAPQAELRRKLIDQLDTDRSPIGAAMMAPLLTDPPKDAANRALPAPADLKKKILLMIGQRGGPDVLPLVVRFLKANDVSPDLAVLAADAVIRAGLPQNDLEPAPAQGGESAESPTKPPVTAGELSKTLSGLDAAKLSPSLTKHRATLIDWLGRRDATGISNSGYWNGVCTIQPGDWLLMRNSSPYNLFTDLSPGLFTHVGIATTTKDKDGRQHMVIVDLNERDTVIRAKNIETVLPRSLYYAVLRHQDEPVAKKMSEVAASLIGNPMKFDLTFETAKAVALQGKPLAGTKIETYCAGLLMLAAQETGLPRTEFFPVSEETAPGKTAENMDRIGLRVGADFLSPTGPLFARRMKLIHLSEPMFDPRREIEQRIYDHFAQQLAIAPIEPKNTLYQSLRQQLAEASKTNPFLAKAIADAAGVDRETDLSRAARAAAVVETLDEVAYDNSSDFDGTLRAMRAGALDDRAKARFSEDDIAWFKELRERHDDLIQKFEKRQLSPRDVNETLIAYYVTRGKQQIDKYFFPSAVAPTPTPK